MLPSELANPICIVAILKCSLLSYHVRFMLLLWQVLPSKLSNPICVVATHKCSLLSYHIWFMLLQPTSAPFWVITSDLCCCNPQVLPSELANPICVPVTHKCFLLSYHVRFVLFHGLWSDTCTARVLNNVSSSWRIVATQKHILLGSAVNCNAVHSSSNVCPAEDGNFNFGRRRTGTPISPRTAVRVAW
jgi:hypothetical protein